MLQWLVEECHQFFAVFLLAQRRPGVFCIIGFDERIERFFRTGFGLSLPNVVYSGLRLWLRQHW